MWSVTPHMEVLAHCRLCEVTGRVNGKQGAEPEEQSRNTHHNHVCNSIQTHTGLYEKETYIHHSCTIIHKRICTRKMKIIQHIRFTTECQYCDLIRIDTYQKHMLLIIHKCPCCRHLSSHKRLSHSDHLFLTFG